MTAKWTLETEQRFTELRLRQLSGILTEAEQQELTAIQAKVEEIEAATVAPALKRLESEQHVLQKNLENLQTDNTELVQLLNLQALLIADTKRWLEEFEQRYALIQTSFTRLTDHSWQLDGYCR